MIIKAKKKVVFIAIFCGCGLLLNSLFFYKDHSIWSTDARIETYDRLPDDSLDVLLVGSSNIMSGINPVQLWEETGIQSYNYCSRAQTFPFTYAYLCDALKRQAPKCIIIDAYSVLSDKSVYGLINSATHLEMNFSSLKPSGIKYELMKENLPWRERLSLAFPIIKHHSRYKNWFEKDETENIYMGYCFASETASLEQMDYSDGMAEFQGIDKIYIDKIIELCNRKKLDLIFIKTPVSITEEQHSKINGLKAYLSGYNISFYDCSDGRKIKGFNFAEDMHDAYHLNENGAEKMTSYLTELLRDKYSFDDTETHVYASVWEGEMIRMENH